MIETKSQGAKARKEKEKKGKQWNKVLEQTTIKEHIDKLKDGNDSIK